jgi:capsular exopolysaccharide synthesis family protein
MELHSVLAALRRRWIVLVVCVLAGVGGGWYTGHHGVKTYRATARVLVNVPAAGQLSEALAGVQLSNDFLVTYSKLASSRAVATRVVNQLQLQEPVTAVQGQISATPEANTFIIDISVDNSDPQRAASLANEVSVALRDQVAQLEQGRPDPITVQLLDDALAPSHPIKPKPRTALILGIVLGVLAGALLLGALESLDRSVRTTGQTDALVRAPLLAVIAKHRDNARALVAADDTDPRGEPYRALRTAVRFLDPDSPVQTLIVSSPGAGDGKTTVAANLAVALASSGMRIIVVDADLRRPQLGSAFGLESAVGLTSVVNRQVDLHDALQEWRPNLQVLPSGPLPPNPSEILGSETVASILAELSGMAEMLIIDAPPVLPVTDAVVLGTQADGVLLVIRHGKTKRNDIAATRRQLDTVGVPILGYVYNGTPGGLPSGYYYAYDRRDAGPRPLRRGRPVPASSHPDRA